VSRLLRRSLTGGAGADAPGQAAVMGGTPGAVAGFVPFAPRAGVVATNEQVNALRDAEGL
jgi:hypothetical protein